MTRVSEVRYFHVGNFGSIVFLATGRTCQYICDHYHIRSATRGNYSYPNGHIWSSTTVAPASEAKLSTVASLQRMRAWTSLDVAECCWTLLGVAGCCNVSARHRNDSVRVIHNMSPTITF